MANDPAGTIRYHKVWAEMPPAGTPQDRPWLAGVWDDNWPVETFTTGEALPPGPIATLGTFHNQAGQQHQFGLRLFSVPHGWRRLVMPFSRVRGETPEALVNGVLQVQGEAAIIYHRLSIDDPVTVKLEVPNGSKLLRVYTWWTLIDRLYASDGNGGWSPVP